MIVANRIQFRLQSYDMHSIRSLSIVSLNQTRSALYGQVITTLSKCALPWFTR